MDFLTRFIRTGCGLIFRVAEHNSPAVTQPSPTSFKSASSAASPKHKADDEPQDREKQGKRHRGHPNGPESSSPRTPTPSIDNEDRSKAPESLSKPTTSSKNKVSVVAVEHNGTLEKALLLDGTLRTLLRAVIEAERSAGLQTDEAEAERAHLSRFRVYANAEIQRLETRQEALCADPDGESRLVQALVSNRDLREKLEEARIEEEKIKAREKWAEWIVRKRYYQAFLPLMEALEKEGIINPDPPFPELHSPDAYFAVPDLAKQAETREAVHDSGNSWDAQVRRNLRAARGEGGEEVYYSRGLEYLKKYDSPAKEQSPPIVSSREVLNEVRLRRQKLHRARAQLGRRDRETGADFFLRRKRNNENPGIGSPLEFDLRQFEHNNALTRAVVDAEKRLAEAKAAARELKLDATTSSESSDFNDPDGDTNPRRRMSGIHHTAIGIRTDQIDEWMKTLPEVEMHVVPLVEPRPEKPELDEWSAEPIGNNESSSVIAGGRRGEKINAERQATEDRKRGARDEWCQSYPKRRRITFAKWHENKRGGLN